MSEQHRTKAIFSEPLSAPLPPGRWRDYRWTAVRSMSTYTRILTVVIPAPVVYITGYHIPTRHSRPGRSPARRLDRRSLAPPRPSPGQPALARPGIGLT